ncbi:staygreen family protein [Virgibacillus halodenitrificans]|uniref:staygreen family protein n=1 Tax=Virgibacillus halodenitrificans TaxID=1482 RepID=UPI001F3C3D0A|nr:staygreen family protein [Virgibacillus halodenitrificans]
MCTINLKKLSVRYIPPADFNQPVSNRKYTLTHSDTTGQLFLDIGYVYNYEAINPAQKDEVLAEWRNDPSMCMYLAGTVDVDGIQVIEATSAKRFEIFNREMNTALQGMIYGDLPFYSYHPFLINAPIFISYNSAFPQYRQVKYYGTPRYYIDKL